jgi:hypothetical protein
LIGQLEIAWSTCSKTVGDRHYWPQSDELSELNDYSIDILGDLVRLSETDRPFGVQAEVLSTIIKLVSALDEHFLVHAAVHKAVIRLLRVCVGDEIQEPIDGSRLMGAAGSSIHADPSEYELEGMTSVQGHAIYPLLMPHTSVVDLLCTLCTRIRTYPDLLLIFLHDKNWYLPLIPTQAGDDEDEVAPSPPQNQPRAASPTPSNASTITSAPSAAVPRKPEYEFLIFNYLLRFVHREGKIGDLARGGIISLIDVAMTAGEGSGRDSDDASAGMDPVGEAALALAEYVLDGDFSDVLCAGLGAVYSELPTKLEIRHEDDDILGQGMVLGGLADEARAQREEDISKAQKTGIVFSTDPLFRARLDHFIKLLEFVQDVLLRIGGRMEDPIRKSFAPSALVGSAVTQAIMDTFRRTFLKNVLYPSLLECSENDGSSVAVMVYIDEMLRSLSEASLSDLILAFLMSEEDDDDHARPSKYRSERVLDGRRLKAAKRVKRKSSAMILLEAVKPEDANYFSSLGRFTLKDLIISNLRSPAQAAATAALRLLRSLFTNHCHLTVDRLITVTRDLRATNFGSRKLRLHKRSYSQPDSPVSNDEEFVYPGTSPQKARDLSPVPEPETTVFDHDREIRMYMDLVDRVVPSCQRGPVDLTDDDAAFSTRFENYICDAIATIEEESCFVDDDQSVLSMPRHRLVPTDALLGALLQSLRLFFSHTPEHNMQLSGVLAAISACPHRSIAGWLMEASQDDAEVKWPEETKEDDVAFDDDDRSIDYGTDELLRSGRKPSQWRRKKDNGHLPVIYVIMSGLVSQLDRYRRTVNGFDSYLEERRRGLLFTENISDALNLHFKLSADAMAARASTGVKAAPSPPPNTPAKVAKTTLASVTHFFTPSKKSLKPAAPTMSGQHPQTPAKGNRDASTIPATPFTPHYMETSAIDIEPYIAPGPIAGPWSPAGINTGGSRQSLALSSFEDDGIDVFSAPSKTQGSNGTKGIDLELQVAARVSLSQLLDNVVILEEAIKELAAILQVRRSIGIDSLRYV